MISPWETIHLQLLAMKGFDAIRPEYNCFILMTISVESLCGFLALRTVTLNFGNYDCTNFIVSDMVMVGTWFSTILYYVTHIAPSMGFR